MSSTTATKIIEALRQLFSAYGLPEQLVSNNGPQFVAQEFDSFMKINGIKHIRTLPYHLASNGVVERLVQTFKKAMNATNRKETTKSQQLASFLLSYRTTPYAITNTAPVELFMNRMLRKRLDLIHPDVELSVNTAQGCQKTNYDKLAKAVRFIIGQRTLAKNFKNGPTWLPGVIFYSILLMLYSVPALKDS